MSDDTPTGVDLQRFWAKVDKNGPEGCWLWTAITFWDGYGQFYLRGKKRRAHRISWEMHNGVIPDGAKVDHECHNRSVGCPRGVTCLHRRCVNPSHLRLATNQENILASPWAVVARTGRCREGHPVTHQDNHGSWYCYPCRQKRHRERRMDLYGPCPICGVALSRPDAKRCRKCRFK